MSQQVSNEVIMFHIKGLRGDIDALSKSMKEFMGTISENYVTKEAFEPVQKIVYGFVKVILGAFAVASVAAAAVWMIPH